MRLLILFLTVLQFAPCQLLSQQWLKTFGGIGYDYTTAAVLDSAGNLFSTGNFQSIIDFDPGPIAYTVSSQGESDAYLNKLDKNGNFLWAITFGGKKTETPKSIALDNGGNIYITGEFMDTVDFDPGPSSFTLSASGRTHAFILKLDSSGNFVWVKKFGPPILDAIPITLSIDDNKNVIIAGCYNSDTDFDPGPSSYVLYADGVVNGFVLKLNANGGFVWARRIGANDVILTKIKQDKKGNFAILGSFIGPLTLYNTQNTYTLNPFGQRDIFLSVIDSVGVFKWVKQFGGFKNDLPEDLEVDDSKNLYITGTFNDTADFDPGTAIYNLSISQGDYSAFAVKLDSSTNFVWAKKTESSGSTEGRKIFSDLNENVFAVSVYDGTVSATNDQSNIFTTSGGQDILVQKLNQTGNCIWSCSMGTVNHDQIAAGLLNADGDLILTGTYQNTFVSACNNFTQTTSTNNIGDVYILKIFSGEMVGINPINEEVSFKLFPNPTTHRLYYDSPKKVSGIQVLNCMGQQLFSSNSVSAHGIVDVSFLSQGVYFIRMIVDEKILIYKILKTE